MKDQRGQVMALALAVMGVGALLVGPFLGGVSVHSIAARTYSDSILQVAACDAGVEDAIWGLTNGTLAGMLVDPGDTVSYSLAEPVNGIVPAVVVTLGGGNSSLASDDFESGDWSGGSGWLADWVHAGRADVTNSGGPHAGSRHLRLRGGQSKGSYAYAARSADLSDESGLHLQLWAMVSGTESTDEVYCRVSPDGSSWTTVETWTNADDDSTYHFYDIDISSLAPYSSTFWIAFESAMNQSNDHFYVDDLSIVGQSAGYEVVSTAGSERIRTDIAISEGAVTISSWQIERTQE